MKAFIILIVMLAWNGRIVCKDGRCQYVARTQPTVQITTDTSNKPKLPLVPMQGDAGTATVASESRPVDVQYILRILWERMENDERFRGSPGSPGLAGVPGPRGEKGEPGVISQEMIDGIKAELRGEYRQQIDAKQKEIDELRAQVSQLTRQMKSLLDVTFRVELVDPDGQIQSGDVHPNTGTGVLRINLSREEL